MLSLSDVPPLQYFLDSTENLGIQFLIIIILMLINAFFAMSELAIISASPIKIGMLAKENNKNAILVQKLQSDDTKLLSTIQVGITLAGFFSSATAAVSLSEGLGNLLAMIEWFPAPQEVALVLVTLILSYFTLVFGELFPKRIALSNPEKIAMFVARPIMFIKFIFTPIVLLLSGSTNLIAKIFRVKADGDEKVTEDEVKELLSTAVDDGTIHKDEAKIIDSVFVFGDLLVRDVMRSQVDVFMIDIDDDIETIRKQIKDEKYTRIPVFKGDKDNIIGILNIKDLFFAGNSGYTHQDIKKLLREPYFVVESMKAEKLFKQLKENKSRIAIVINEDGSTSGFLTMEDLVEEVMGNIYDEYDEKDDTVIDKGNGIYLVNATVPIQDVNRYLDIDITMNSEEYNTLSGYITHNIQYLPKTNEEFDFLEDKIHIKIMEVKHNRITKVELSIINENEDEE